MVLSFVHILDINKKKENEVMSEVLIRSRVLSNGKIVYEYSFEIASDDGKRKRITKSGFKTKKAAKEEGRLAQQTYETSGVRENVSAVSYSDFLNMWINIDVKPSCKEKTVENYNKKIRLYIKPALGRYRLKSITKGMLQDFITKLYDDGFSVNTISGIRGIITKSMKFAVDSHYLQYSPAGDLKIPTNRNPKVKTNMSPHIYITKSQIDRIIQEFPEGSSFYIPFMIGYHCGLRLGEIFGLVWEDIDFDNKILKVSRQIQWKVVKRSGKKIAATNGTSESDGYWYFCEPKYKSYRVVDLDNDILAILEREKKKQEKSQAYYEEYYTRYYSDEELYCGGKMPNDYIIPENRISDEKNEYEINFVIRRENGTYINSRTTTHYTRVVREKLGIKDFDMHSLRHTHATMLMENGVDLVYIQHRLGHKDVKVTMNIYTNHMTEKIVNSNNEKLNNIYKQ